MTEYISFLNGGIEVEEKETQENKKVSIKNWGELLEDVKARTGNILNNEASKRYIYAAFTDKVILKHWLGHDWQQTADEEGFVFGNMLECRIFNEECEYRLARTALGEEWRRRIKIDKKTNEKSEEKNYFDEQQYFDIDDTKRDTQNINSSNTDNSNPNNIKGDDTNKYTANNMISNHAETEVYATGGGRYSIPVSLPETKNVMLKIRNYVNYYEETGQAYVADWRLVSIGQAEKQEEKKQGKKQGKKQEEETHGKR